MKESNYSNVSKKQVYIFNTVIIWTIITSLFAWLPLVRIIGRPKEYYWGVMDFNGEGTDGPYWIFILASVFVIFMLYSTFRSRKRIVAYISILIWQLVILFIVCGILSENTKGEIQGQGLHWELPLWLVLIPNIVFLVLTLYWIYLEYTQKKYFIAKPWTLINSRLLGASVIFLLIAITLFRLGNNYNWVTSLAIIVTIFQWFFMVESFKPKGKLKN